VFDLVRYAVPHIPKGGSIINVGSIQAYVKIKMFVCIKLYYFVFSYDPSAEILDYAATKAAIVGFTKGLADKLLEKGIRVNAVAVNKLFYMRIFYFIEIFNLAWTCLDAISYCFISKRKKCTIWFTLSN
jgi:NAD(P)-dependent dehydrogenase (short-subunit alcohol dehydrogenase family)